MSWFDRQASCPVCAMNRRQFFRTGASLAAAGAAVLTFPGLAAGATKSPWSLSLAANGRYGAITHSVAGQKRLS